MARIEPEHASKGLRLGNRKLSHLPPRLITGAYIVNTGVSKLGAGRKPPSVCTAWRPQPTHSSASWTLRPSLGCVNGDGPCRRLSRLQHNRYPVPVHDGHPHQEVPVFDAATGGMGMRLISLQELKEAIVRRVREVPSVG
jgi:hypothetical protein